MPLKDKPMGVIFLILLFCVMGGINILAGIFSALAWDLTWVTNTFQIFGGVLLLASLILILLGIFQLAVAYGIYEREPWAKISVMLFAILGLLSFPVGTILSIIILILLFTPEVKTYFAYS